MEYNLIEWKDKENKNENMRLNGTDEHRAQASMWYSLTDNIWNGRVPPKNHPTLTIA